MGLKLTLDIENSYIAVRYVDAYWKLENVRYSTTEVGAELFCYPSREASQLNLVPMPSPTLPIGAPIKNVYEPRLYRWNILADIVDIFPNGIPLDENAQKTAIYIWVKSYTGLPFEDVFEDVQ